MKTNVKKGRDPRTVYCACLAPVSKVVGKPDRQRFDGSTEVLVLARWCPMCREIKYFRTERHYRHETRTQEPWSNFTPSDRSDYLNCNNQVLTGHTMGAELIGQWTRDQAKGVWPFGRLA